jgi:hypothetical protein
MIISIRPGEALLLRCATLGDVKDSRHRRRIIGDNHWIARVAPLKEPGLLSRLFGAKFVSREREVLSISRCMHNWLVEAGCEGVLWRIDGFPEPANGHPEPVAIGEDAAD